MPCPTCTAGHDQSHKLLTAAPKEVPSPSSRLTRSKKEMVEHADTKDEEAALSTPRGEGKVVNAKASPEQGKEYYEDSELEEEDKDYANLSP